MSLGRRAEEIARDIADRIRSGEWQVLPTIEQMMPVYSCKGGTLSRVLQHLRDQGVVVKNEARRGPPRWVVVTPEVPDVVGYARVIADQIADRVAAREWDALPTIDELKVLCGTSLATVVEALRELERRGLVTKHPHAKGPGRWIVVDDSRSLPRSRVEAVAAQIHARTTSGEWAELPSARELRGTIKAHASAVDGALKLLAAEGVIERAKNIQGGPWVLVEPPDGPRCRRVRCVRPPVGRGLCVHHYALWQGGEDPLDLPGDETTDPGIVAWEPPRRDRRTAAEPPTVPSRVQKLAAKMEERIAAGEWYRLPPVDVLRQSFRMSPETAEAVLGELLGRGLVVRDRDSRWKLAEKPSGARAVTLAAEIRGRIARGEWTELPQVRELPRILGAHSTSVQVALKLLAKQGELAKVSDRRGRHWVIAPRETVVQANEPRLVEEIEKNISRGVWSSLPSLGALRHLYGCKHDEITHALRELEQRGVVEQRKRRWRIAGTDAGTHSYERVAHDVARRLDNGELSALPSNRELRLAYGVSPAVVESAMRLLGERGLVVRRGHRWVLPGEAPGSPAADAGDQTANRLPDAHAVAEDMLARIRGGQWREFPRAVDLPDIYQVGLTVLTAAIRILRERGVLTMKGRRTVLVDAQPQTKSERIADELAGRIRAGESVLPVRAQLARSCGAGLTTIDGVLRSLRDRGLEFSVGPRDDQEPLPPRRREGVPRVQEITESLVARARSGELTEFPTHEEIVAFYRCRKDIATAATRLMAERGVVVKKRRWVWADSFEVTPRDELLR